VPGVKVAEMASSNWIFFVSMIGRVAPLHDAVEDCK
jgi:hypothetical protein